MQIIDVTITQSGAKSPQQLVNELVQKAQSGNQALASSGIEAVNGVAVSSGCEVLFSDGSKKAFSNCCSRPTSDAANYRLFWTQLGNSLEITVSATTSGWIGFGFAGTAGQMIGR